MLRLAWGAPCRRIGLGTSKGSLTFAVMDKETGETSFEFIANYPPGMANLPNKMRLHQFTFMPGTGRTLGQTIVKYYCNGAVVATVELPLDTPSYDMAVVNKKSGGAIVFGESVDEQGATWRFNGRVFMLLVHRVTLTAGEVREMSAELLEVSWGVARTGDGTTLGCV